jgi:hypothetical protein
MNRRLLATFVAALALFATLPAAAQTGQIDVEFAEYFVVLAERGPTWTPQTDEKGWEVRMEVIEALKAAVLEQHDVIIAGLVDDASDAEFIMIVQTEDETALRQRLASYKNVANGFFSLNIHSWRAPAGLKLEMVR